MNTLGWQNLYHPDHRNKRLWVRMYKVASTSLMTCAFNHGWSPLTPEQAKAYPDYYLIAFVRHPLDRNVSFYHDGNRRDMSYEQYVNKVLVDQFDNNPHVLPQSSLLIREPDFLGYFEGLDENYERLQTVIGQRFPLPHKNQARAGQPWRTYFDALPVDKQEALTAFYSEDFDRFGYVHPIV